MLRSVIVGSLLLGLTACGESPNPTTGTDTGSTTPDATNKTLTVVVAVIDSLMPEDIDGTAMPNVSSLIDDGTQYMESRSVFSAETIPNHVAMMTGVYPDRNGIPTNNFWDKEALPNTPEDEDLDNPNELTAKTLFTWIDEQCRSGSSPRNADYRTAAVLSKTYLWEIFRGDDADSQTNDIGINNVEPDTHWDPQTSPLYIGPGSEHTIDNSTGPQAVATLADTDFIFINLGDVDRSSHAAGAVARMATRATADSQIGNLITELQDQGRWENTVMILVSDHGMDFSDPLSDLDIVGTTTGLFTGIINGNPIETITNSVSTQPLLDQLADSSCGYQPMLAVQNGGTNSLVVTNLAASDTEKQETVLAARACLLNFDGSNTEGGAPASCESVVGATCKNTLSAPANIGQIDFAWYANPNFYNGNSLLGALTSDSGGIMPASIKSRHENLGDLVLAMGPGYKFSEPDASGNPIPGNHGHLATIHNTMIVSGGADFVVTGNTVASTDDSHLNRADDQSENIDVAATVAWLLGLNITDSQFPDAGASFPDYGDGFVRSGFDGRVLSEAFNTSLPPSDCGLILE